MGHPGRACVRAVRRSSSTIVPAGTASNAPRSPGAPRLESGQNPHLEGIERLSGQRARGSHSRLIADDDPRVRTALSALLDSSPTSTSWHVRHSRQRTHTGPAAPTHGRARSTFFFRRRPTDSDSYAPSPTSSASRRRDERRRRAEEQRARRRSHGFFDKAAAAQTSSSPHSAPSIPSGWLRVQYLSAGIRTMTLV